MDKVIRILFEEHFNGQVLFRNQQDLVNKLMSIPGTEYYVDKSDSEKYVKTQNRLKAYISQLLSPTVLRTITPDFEKALYQIVYERTLDENTSNSRVQEILEELRSKKLLSPKETARQSSLDQLQRDFRIATYISIITSHPLEIEADITSKISLRKLIFDDFIESVISENPLKDYRFNFPNETTGKVFWSGLHKLFVRYIKSVSSASRFLPSIHKKLSLDVKYVINADNVLSDKDLNEAIQNILMALREERKIVVFATEAPIYTLPLIVFDPSAISTAKIYAVVDLEDDNFNVHRFSKEEVIYWRQSVWDKLKSNRYGKIVDVQHDS